MPARTRPSAANSSHLAIEPRGRLLANLILAVLCGLLSIGALSSLDAQTTARQPTVQDGSAEVQRAGFSLHTAGGIRPDGFLNKKPSLQLNFSIDKADHTMFHGLRSDHVIATLDPASGSTSTAEHAIPVSPKDLVDKNPNDSGSVLAIDGSGSMVLQSNAPRTAQSIDKLSAAKDAIYDFLDRLQPDDKVEILAFDEAQSILYKPSLNKEGAKAAVKAFQINLASGQHTSLYDAMKFAVAEASRNSIRNVVFLTDGMEDTEQYNSLRSAELKAAYKKIHEREIAGLASPGKIRIFTIGIGNQSVRETDPAYVDIQTLDRIAKQTGGVEAHYVDLPALARAVQNSPAQYHAALIAELKKILADIDKSVHYDYTLTLHPAPGWIAQDGATHLIRVVCKLEGVDLPVEFPLTWRAGADSPDVGKPDVKQPIFYSISPVGAGALTRTYLIYLVLLLLLALIPVLLEELASRKQVSEAKESVAILKGGSPYLGKPCPNESTHLGRDFLFKKGDAVVVCPQCKTAHHLGCWHLTQDTCWVRTCSFHAPMSRDVLEAYGVID